jgi:hypothetical protein
MQSLPELFEDPVARFKATVTAPDNNILRLMLRDAVRLCLS